MDSSSSTSSWFRWALKKKDPNPSGINTASVGKSELLKFGVTEQLQDFVKAFTLETFKNFSFSFSDDGSASQSKDSSSPNVRKDLSEWQERHAMLVLSTVKEISQIRYVLCPRHLKESEFWSTYFALVKTYVAPYETRAVQEAKVKMIEMEGQKSTEGSADEVEMTEVKQAVHTLLSPEHE